MRTKNLQKTTKLSLERLTIFPQNFNLRKLWINQPLNQDYFSLEHPVCIVHVHCAHRLRTCMWCLYKWLNTDCHAFYTKVSVFCGHANKKLTFSLFFCGCNFVFDTSVLRAVLCKWRET
jgi:hypothetical protein